MIGISGKLRFYLYREPTDMRKSFDGLHGIIRRELAQSPRSGDVFLFVNRRQDRIKLMVWDRDGFWIHYKRLEKGQFHPPSVIDDSSEIHYEDLLLMLEGIDLTNGKKYRRFGR